MCPKSIGQALLLDGEKQVPSRRRNHQGHSREPVRGVPRSLFPLASCPALPRAIFILDWLAPCHHSPGFNQRSQGSGGASRVPPVPGGTRRRVGLAEPSFLARLPPTPGWLKGPLVWRPGLLAAAHGPFSYLING